MLGAVDGDSRFTLCQTTIFIVDLGVKALDYKLPTFYPSVLAGYRYVVRIKTTYTRTGSLGMPASASIIGKSHSQGGTFRSLSPIPSRIGVDVTPSLMIVLDVYKFG